MITYSINNPPIINRQFLFIICHLSSILSLPGESNSRSRTIVAALPSGVSPPDWIPVHARSVTLRVQQPTATPPGDSFTSKNEKELGQPGEEIN